MQHCQSSRHTDREPIKPIIADLGAGALGLLAATSMLWSSFGTGPWVPLLALTTYLIMAGIILAGAPRHPEGLGLANRITLWRGALVALLAGTLADPTLLARHAVPLAALALLALVLDGMDGWVARRTATQSDFGARFDMEIDAFLILVLCLALLVLGKVGSWVLAIGGMRYAFVVAGLTFSWLTAALPESRRRKAVCVWQVTALMTALLPAVGATATTWLAGSALLGLAGSFIFDIHWLYRHAAARHPEHCRTGSHS